jgi:hypothetical protein
MSVVTKLQAPTREFDDDRTHCCKNPRAAVRLSLNVETTARPAFLEIDLASGQGVAPLAS